jgi:hypothetical protein
MSKAFAIAVAVLSAFSLMAVTASEPKPTAEFMIQSDHSNNLWHFRTYVDGANCKGLSPPVRESGPVKINANEPFTFMVSGASSNDIFGYKYCWSNATFTPEQGKKYVASFSFDEKTCSVAVAEVSNEGRSPTSVDIFLRAYKPPFFQSGSWCGKRIGE